MHGYIQAASNGVRRQQAADDKAALAVCAGHDACPVDRMKAGLCMQMPGVSLMLRFKASCSRTAYGKEGYTDLHELDVSA